MITFDAGWPRKHLSGHLLWFLGWVAVVAVALWLRASPAGHGTHTQLGLPPCPTVLLWDRLCPGCGMTTSFVATMHGQWDVALRAHPFGPLVFLLYSLSALACLYGFFKERRFNTDGKAFNVALACLASVFFAFGFWRAVTEPANDAHGVQMVRSPS